MKKLLVGALLLTVAPLAQGAASSSSTNYADLLKNLEDKKELTLQTDTSKSGGPEFTLILDKKEPLTGKTFRQLIQNAWKQNKPYSVAQFLSFDPVVPSYDQPARNYDMSKNGRKYIGKDFLDYQVDDLLYSFVDNDAIDTAFGTKAGQNPTAIDKTGTNLEIEQILKWKILPTPNFKAVRAVLDREEWDAGFIPMHPENPKDLSKEVIALINPKVEVITSWADPKVSPYLVDVVPLSELDVLTQKTFKELVHGTPEEQADDLSFQLARVSTWDSKERKASIAFYDAKTFEKFEADWPDLFKVQIFDIDPNNPNKAYLIRETFNEGFFPRGKFNLEDRSFRSSPIPASKDKTDFTREGY